MELPKLSSQYRLVCDPTSDLLEGVYRLRVLAWRSQARVRAGVVRWQDPLDGSAKHWVILSENHPVAAIRLSLHERLDDLPSATAFAGALPNHLAPPIASYNRLVVHPSHRGRGLAKVLDIVCINAAETAGASMLVGLTGNVSGNKSRIRAMKALGFEEIGPAATADVDILEDEGRSTILAYFYRHRCGRHNMSRGHTASTM